MINISISYRSIKLAAIFITVIILITLAIPAVSDEISSRSGEKRLKLDKPTIFKSQDLKILPANDIYLGAAKVVNMGFDKIEGNNYVWALIYIILPTEQNPVKHYQMVYIPAPRLQTLFEVSLGTGAEMEVYGHLIANPEELNLHEQVQLFEVTRVRVLPGW